MRRPTLLCLFHCAPPNKPQPASDTVLGSSALRHWETPEQGYPSDESRAPRTAFVRAPAAAQTHSYLFRTPT
jgi:hypothetical protein